MIRSGRENERTEGEGTAPSGTARTSADLSSRHRPGLRRHDRRWCKDEAAIPDARKQLHDNLIASMGDRRTGGVQWIWHTGQDAIDFLKAMLEGDGHAPGWNDYIRRLRAMLREYDGWIVAAVADGKRPDG